MKTVIQRVRSANVKVDGQIVGCIGHGLLLLVGFGVNDTNPDLKAFAEKVCNMRLFAADEKEFHVSLTDIKGEVLLISQFTLLADTTRGRRPDFNQAMKSDQAKPLFEKLIEQFQALGVSKVQSGIFGADMLIASENYGPVTIISDFEGCDIS